MRTFTQSILLALLLTGQSVSTQAALDFSWSGAQVIPDNNGAGLAYDFSLSNPADTITGISVTMDVSGGFNGDLYVYLSHGEGFSVLMNRVGRSASSDFGYSSPGFVITLTDTATADMHNYQTLNPTYNGNGQLTGTWAADGRDVDPSLALDTTERTATLASFQGLNPNGNWTLYFRDASQGDFSTLNAWSVEVSAVPEPVNVALGVFAALGLLMHGRRAWRTRAKKPASQSRNSPVFDRGNAMSARSPGNWHG